ncbi:MAG: helix-turn-helix domain-containing protein [Flavobacteriaceae bacterium]
MKLTLDFLLISGILFTCLILILLKRKKKNEIHDKVLASVFIFILLVFLNYYAYLHRIRLLFYSTEVFADSIDVFIGPLFLVYIKGVIGKTPNSYRSNAVHFIFPVIYLFAISIPDTLGSVVKDLNFAYLESVQNFLFFTIFYSFAYCVYSLGELIKFKKLVKFNYSNLENKDLTWVRNLLIGALLIIAIDAISTILEAFSIDIGNDEGFMTVIPIVFLMAYVGYYGVTQSKVLLPDFLMQAAGVSAEPFNNDNLLPSQKYVYDASEMKQMAIDLEVLMREKKPFLNEDLTLATLAELLGVPDKKLSTLLNQNMNTSFYDYVNGYRITEVKQKMALPESETYTLLAIAYDSGFKSKASFNRIFKKSTQLSPSDYRKKFISNSK